MRAFLFVFSVILLATASLARADAPACATTPLTSPLTPEKLQSFLKNRKIKKVEDLVCCLPDDYKNSFVIIHSSFSLQDGVPNHPRVLLFPPVRPGQTEMQSVLTITGDDKNLNKSNHVEVLYNNKTKGEAEVYDINFDRDHRLSEKNPQECMGCHGSSTHDVNLAGAKPIFTNSPWPYAVSFDSGSIHSPSFPYMTEVQKRAVNAVQTQPRYACLKKLPTDQNALSRQLSTAVVTLDALAENLNNKRVAKLIVASPDYKRFRPLILGAGLCFSGRINTAADLHRFEKDFAQWVPPAVADGIFNDDQRIAPKYRELQNLQQASRNYNQQIVDDELAARQAQSKLKDVGAAHFIFSPASLRHYDLNQKKLDKTKLPLFSEIKSLKEFSPAAQLFARYAADSQFDNQVGFGASPLFRFLFEGRGISTVTWTRGMAGDQTTFLQVPSAEIKALTADDPYWKNVGHLMDQIAASNPLAGDGGATARKTLCETLRKQSFENFSNGADKKASSSTGAH